MPAQILTFIIVHPISGNRSEIEEVASEYLTYRIGKYIHQVYLPFIVLVGLAFNFLSLAVLLRGHNRQNPFCVFVAGLAFWDLVVLTASLGGWFLGVVRQSMTDIDCHVITFFCQIASATTTFLLVAVTAERCLLVSLPGHVFPWRTPCFSGGIIFVMFIVGLLTAVPSALSAHQLDVLTCASWSKDPSEEYPIILVLAFGFLPCVAIFIMNIRIIRLLRKAAKHRRLHSTPSEDCSHNTRMSNNWESGSTVSSISDDDVFFVDAEVNIKVCGCIPSKSRSSTINPKSPSLQRENTQATILLIMSFTFLILRLPLYIHYVVYCFIDPRRDPTAYATYILLFNIANKMYLTDCAIDSMLICAISSTFRKDLCGLICCCCQKETSMPERELKRTSHYEDTRF